MDEQEQSTTALVVADAVSEQGISSWAGALGSVAGLMTLPGVAENVGRAISQLVLGTSDVIKAWVLDIPRLKAEQIQKRILDVTALNTQVVESAAQAVKAGADPLAQRARVQDYFRGAREQQNREAVLHEALKELAERTPTRDASRPVDDDLLTQLSDAASKVSNKDVQRLLGRVLAGEVSSPGSYSVDTVLRLATMSPYLAALFKRFADSATIFTDLPGASGIILFDKTEAAAAIDARLSWDDLTELRAAGLVKGEKGFVTFKDERPGREIGLVALGEEVRLRFIKPGSLSFPMLITSRLGSELLRAMPKGTPPGTYATELWTTLRRYKFAELLTAGGDPFPVGPGTWVG